MLKGTSQSIEMSFKKTKKNQIVILDKLLLRVRETDTLTVTVSLYGSEQEAGFTNVDTHLAALFHSLIKIQVKCTANVCIDFKVPKNCRLCCSHFKIWIQ